MLKVMRKKKESSASEEAAEIKLMEDKECSVAINIQNNNGQKIVNEDWVRIFKKLVIVNSNSCDEINIEKLVTVIMSLNESTLSYWWRGGMTLEREFLVEVFNQVDYNRNGHISVCEFCSLMQEENTAMSIEMKTYIAKSLRTISMAKKIRKCPPPLFNPILSILQIILFIVNLAETETSESTSGHSNSNSTFSYLIFKGTDNSGGWQYLTYCLVHHSFWNHLLLVIFLQLFLGVVMEMVDGFIRTCSVYFFGVICGSIASYIIEPLSNLEGGSGGCYALLGGHLASLILNWNEDHAIVVKRMRHFKNIKILHGKLIRNLKLLGLILFIAIDITLFYLQNNNQTSYEAHVFGFVAGFLLSYLIAKNRVETSCEKVSKVIVIVLILFLLILGIVLNLVL